MFDRFTDRAKKTLSLARLTALQHQHDCIDDEHLLLGLLGLGAGTACQLLRDAGVDPATLHAAASARVQRGPHPVTAQQLPFTVRARQVLERSMAAAGSLGHDHIGSEHLLLGLLAVTDGAASVLRDAGITYEAMFTAVGDFTGADVPPPAERRQRLELLLVSNSTMHGGGYLAHCADAIREILGPRKRVAFVPYALADHDAYAAKAQAAFAALGHDLIPVHRGADPRAVVDAADAVFVGGGNTFRLLQRLRQTGLLQAIRRHALLGKPYIGSSAGTNVATLSIRTTNDMPIVHPGPFEALMLVPFQINPHYLDPDPTSSHMGETREERIRQFHEEHTTPVLGLREGCWLRVRGERITLQGSTNARLFRRGEAPVEYAPPCDLSFLSAVAGRG